MGAPGKLDVAGRSGQVGEEMQPAGRQFNGHPIAEDLAQRLGERAASCGIEGAHALEVTDEMSLFHEAGDDGLAKRRLPRVAQA